jgi:hypothetical protein
MRILLISVSLHLSVDVDLPTHAAKHICNSHKPTHSPKLQKSLSVSSADFADTKKLNLLRQRKRMTELKKYLKPLTDKNAQLVTGGIFYCRDSAGFSVSASNKLSCNLTRQCFEIGNKNIPPGR